MPTRCGSALLLSQPHSAVARAICAKLLSSFLLHVARPGSRFTGRPTRSAPAKATEILAPAHEQRAPAQSSWLASSPGNSTSVKPNRVKSRTRIG